MRQGFHGTSMRQVAREAGITPAAIYNHFANKETLFTGLLLERSPHAAVTEALLGAQGEDTQALVLDGMRRMWGALDPAAGGFRLLLIELIEFRGEHAGRVAQAFFPRALAFIGRLQASRPGLRPIPPVVAARTFLGLFMSYALTASLLGRLPGFEESPADLETLADVFLRGVGAEDRPSFTRARGKI
jgi:AcrR family transcriptional regulator